MFLRDLSETALLLTWYAGMTPTGAVLDPPSAETEFWRYVRFLEHLWHKELRRFEPAPPDDGPLVYYEILTAQLLVGALSRAFETLDTGRTGLSRRQLAEHHRAVDRLMDECRRRQSSPAGLLRLRRASQRLDVWKDLLLQARERGWKRPAGGSAGARSGGREAPWPDCATHGQLVLSLRGRGLASAAPDQEISDETRRTVYRLLLELATRMLSPQMFLSSGRVKPPLAQRVTAGDWCDSTLPPPGAQQRINPR